MDKDADTTSCDTCGFGTTEPLAIQYRQKEYNFCCFECAIKAVAPECPHCEVKIIGHGKYGQDSRIFCCEHCAEAERDAMPASPA